MIHPFVRQPVRRVAIVGCVGLPARYGGFETLAANLVAWHDSHAPSGELAVWCSARAYPDRTPRHGGARLHYVPLDANGPSSILYDAVSLLQAVWRRNDAILVLGVSGAIALPLVRLLSRAKLVVNIDGLEWKRPKWSRAAAGFLRLSERIAVRFAHVVVADNQGIVDHVHATYGRDAVAIPYGGEHAVASLNDLTSSELAPSPHALMLCRIEPENSIHLILEAFARADALDLVAVGNWDASDYGRDLRARWAGHPRIRILDPVFDPRALAALRRDAALYVHGHSAGGTNPALVEMMHFATPVVAFDCVYNRYTTEDGATYFADVAELTAIVRDFQPEGWAGQGLRMREIARRRYTWDSVGRAYFTALGAAPQDPR